MKTVQELALQYAKALVAYHEISKQYEISGLREDKYASDNAYNDLYVAQEELNTACQQQAVSNFNGV